MPQVLLFIMIFLTGLVVGSFLNCVIYRLELPSDLPRRSSLWRALRGRSYCPYCKNTLSWQDLIPVLSFLTLKGRCRHCQKKISFQYPLVEIATGLLFVLIFNFSAEGGQNLLNVGFLLLVACFLIIIFVYDLKYFIIPDKVIYPAILIVLGFRIRDLVDSWSPGLEDLRPFFAAFMAAGFFLFIIVVSRGRWMGLGDVKLAFLIGLFLSCPDILTALFFAFLIGAIIGVGLILAKRKTLKSEVPFGPFLVTGTFIALFWSPTIIGWYLDLFNLTV
jgi:prepilin signal peptidase PulO-like enzyme (type II secretory pathway)